MSTYDPNLIVPLEVIQAVQTLEVFARKHSTSDDWQIGGLGPVFALRRQLAAFLADAADLQRQLAEVTRQRDTYKAMLDLQNLRADRAGEKARCVTCDGRGVLSTYGFLTACPDCLHARANMENGK